MNGSLHERQNAFKEQFQLSKPVIHESESQSKPELIQEVKDNIGIAPAQKEDAILFTLPTTKPNKEEILIPPLTNKKVTYPGHEKSWVVGNKAPLTSKKKLPIQNMRKVG